MRSAEKRRSKTARTAAAIERSTHRAPPRRPRRSSSTTKPVTPSSTISGIAPSCQTMTGVPKAIASMTTSPNGSGQSIGKTSAAALAEELRLLRLVDLADIFDRVAVDQRLDRLAEIGWIVVVDLGGDLQLHAGAAGDLDGAVGPLVARQPAEEGEIRLGRGSLSGQRQIFVQRQAVIDVADPVRRAPAAGAGASRSRSSGKAGQRAYAPAGRA